MTIAQSSPLNTPIINVTAVDNDEADTPNSAITFSLVDTSLPFSIDSTSGLLATSEISPELLAQVYNIMVVATDGGGPALSSTGTITVDVAPPNFRSPQFQADLSVTVVENDNSTSDVAFQFNIMDGDAGDEGAIQLVFLPSLYSNNFTATQSAPTADGTTVVRVFYTGGPGFDREALRNFTLPVRATDQGNPLFRRSTDAELFVSVEDVNDNPPVFVGAPYSEMVSENAAIGVVVATVAAVDDDEGRNAEITYSLDYAGAEFRINETTGDILVDGSLLGFVQQPITIPLSASDGMFMTTTNITISVIDVNDNSPQFTPPPPETLTIPEDTEVLITLLNISVSDADVGLNGAVVFSIEQDGSVLSQGSYQAANEFFIALNEPLDAEVRSTISRNPCKVIRVM